MKARLYIIITILFIVTTGNRAAAQPPTRAVTQGSASLPPCSTEKVNSSCLIIIDRYRPVQPPTIQMYPDAFIQINFVNQLPFERPYLDWQSTTATVPPDASAAVVNTLLAQAKSFAFFALTKKHELEQTGTTPTCPEKLPDSKGITEAEITACLVDFRTRTIEFYQTIEPVTNTNSIRPGIRADVSTWSPQNFPDWVENTLCQLYGTDAKIYGNGKQPNCKYKDSLLAAEQNLSGVIKGLIDEHGNYVNSNISHGDAAIFVGLAGQADKMQQDLTGFGQRLLDLLGSSSVAETEIGTIVDPAISKSQPPKEPPSCNLYGASTEVTNRIAFPFSVLRQVSCTLNVLNLVGNQTEGIPTSSQKKSIVTITAVFGDSRVETSVGALFSYIPSRTLVAQNIFTTANPPTVDHIQVQDQRIFPLVVPFAAVNARIKSDFIFLRHRSAWYGTVLAGVNPNTSIADFGAGFSFSWRSVMISPLAHFAHDIQLKQGFKVGEILPANFSGGLPTEKFWKVRFALGISVRTAVLSGR